MYVILTLATYVLLAVIASTLLFSVVVLVVAIQEAFRVLRKKGPRIIRSGELVAERPTVVIDARPIAESAGSCASTVTS
jgi:hypothetical protein